MMYLPTLLIRRRLFRISFLLIILTSIYAVLQYAQVYGKGNYLKLVGYQLKPEKLQKERKATIEKVCSRQKLRHGDTQNIINNMFVDQKDKILYCGIPKVGCTFIKRLLMVLTSDNNKLKSPFDIPPPEAHTRYLPIVKMFKESNRTNMIETYDTFMFLREPYKRLFSGYVDKIFTPQFQHTYGRYIISKYRKHPSKKSLKCGHDVTFEEFVYYVMDSIINGTNPNFHFTPMYRQCNPCLVKYDFVGRLESMTDDLSLIIPHERLNQFLPKNLREHSNMDELSDAVSIGFNNLKNRKGCLTYRQVLERIWRRLQIRGILSRNIDFPLTTERSENINREEFYRVLNASRIKSNTDPSTRKNREESMVEAFRTIPPYAMERLKQVLEIDLQMFGYDTRPSYIFKPKAATKTDFSYFDLLKS